VPAPNNTLLALHGLPESETKAQVSKRHLAAGVATDIWANRVRDSRGPWNPSLRTRRPNAQPQLHLAGLKRNGARLAVARTTAHRRLRTAHRFRKRCHLPNCVGVPRAPPGSRPHLAALLPRSLWHDLAVPALPAKRFRLMLVFGDGATSTGSLPRHPEFRRAVPTRRCAAARCSGVATGQRFAVW